MIASVKVHCPGVPGGTVAALERVMQQRSRILKETAKDAVIATAIDVLVSLRAATRSAKKRKTFKSKIEELPGLHPGFTGGPAQRRCLRRKDGTRYETNLRVRYLTRSKEDGKRSKVYKVTPEHEKMPPYLVAALSKKAVKDLENSRGRRRVHQYGNLAKWAHGAAMKSLSTRNVSDDLTAEARAAGQKLSHVKKTEGGFNSGTFAVEVLETLDYAIAALRNGSATIDLSMQKAANKIAGRLMHIMNEAGKLDKDLAIPFPEIRGKRK